MHHKIYNCVPEEAKYIRYTVFIDEQGFDKEIDEHDDDNQSRHIVLFDGDKAIATARYFEEAKGVYHAGRIAVLKEYRGKGYGREILQYMEEDLKSIGADKITISAQLHAKGFYESLGYTVMGNTYLEEGKEHIWCEKEIKK